MYRVTLLVFISFCNWAACIACCLWQLQVCADLGGTFHTAVNTFLLCFQLYCAQCMMHMADVARQVSVVSSHVKVSCLYCLVALLADLQVQQSCRSWACSKCSSSRHKPLLFTIHHRLHWMFKCRMPFMPAGAAELAGVGPGCRHAAQRSGQQLQHDARTHTAAARSHLHSGGRWHAWLLFLSSWTGCCGQAVSISMLIVGFACAGAPT
jgi:hypothetical protein